MDINDAASGGSKRVFDDKDEAALAAAFFCWVAGGDWEALDTDGMLASVLPEDQARRERFRVAAAEQVAKRG